MSKTRLPIGIQTFREIREENYYYVDKTAYIRRLVDEGKYYFLSRPRRFGKSLLLDTIKDIFQGSKALFEGLAIHSDWDWSVRFPVLRLDFGAGNFKDAAFLQAHVAEQLAAIERRTGVESQHTTLPGRLAALLEALHDKTEQRVVVLVDEYDKPILDALDESHTAHANRDFLRGLYATFKTNDAHIKFVFLTGVSKFSKVNLFSGLNNLRDITLEPVYSAICGYTENDLDEVFAHELNGLDRDKIRDWYNGYNWLGAEKVYNPFDLLLLFQSRRFKAHWFETGSPTFLVDTLFKRRVSPLALEDLRGTDELLSKFDIDDIGTEALLFQTGYLTIVEEKRLGDTSIFKLGYPNREVKESLNRALLHVMGVDRSRQTLHGEWLWERLAMNDFSGLEALFRAYFAGIPYEWHSRNDIANYEGYYASVFYAWFCASGLDTRVEDSSSQGRLDMAVHFSGNIYLFEFKMAQSTGRGAALAQIKEKRYADKYRGLGQPIHLIGIEFNARERNISGFEVESV